MAFTKFNFSDPALNYASVEATVKLMYAYIVHKESCCTQGENSILNKVDIFLRVMEIDLANSFTVRYKNAVKAAYLLLYPLT